jgi:uncharacterized membrane protein
MKARVVIIAWLCAGVVYTHAQTLTWVSTVPDTLVYAMNSNATVLVGYSTSQWTYAFRWTRATGEQRLPVPPGTLAVMARGVSEDGTMIAGSYVLSGGQGWKPIVWRVQGSTITYHLLPTLPDVPPSESYLVQGISGDGRLVVAHIGTPYGACYWLDGQVYRLPAAAGDAQGVTRTGIVFGSSYRWTLERGIERLPVAPGWITQCLSPDGRYGSGSATNNQIMYFDPCGGVSLGSAPGGGYGAGTAISDDGRIVVGYQRNVGAIRWRRENGFLDGIEILNQCVRALLGRRVPHLCAGDFRRRTLHRRSRRDFGTAACLSLGHQRTLRRQTDARNRFRHAFGFGTMLAFGQRLTILPIPDGYHSPNPRYISRDGTVVVGSIRDRYNEYAVYWHNGQMAFVPNFVSGSVASAAKTVGGVSADGSVIAVIGDPFGYLWNRLTGQFTELYPRNRSRQPQPRSISADGRTVVGSIIGNLASPVFRWKADEGLDIHRHFGFSGIVSADGETIYGQVEASPARATDLCGFETLVELGAPLGTIPVDVSDDDEYLLLRLQGGSVAYLWQASTRTTYEIRTPTNDFLFPTAVAQDGTTYGYYWIGSSGIPRGYRWHFSTGLQDLNEVYACLIPDGFLLFTVDDATPDNRYLAGRLRRLSDNAQFAYLLDTRACLPGDVDCNGCVDDADLLMVLFNFGATGRGLNADVNCDTIVDDADLLIVLFNFGTGC